MCYELHIILFLDCFLNWFFKVLDLMRAPNSLRQFRDCVSFNLTIFQYFSHLLDVFTYKVLKARSGCQSIKCFLLVRRLIETIRLKCFPHCIRSPSTCVWTSCRRILHSEMMIPTWIFPVASRHLSATTTFFFGVAHGDWLILLIVTVTSFMHQANASVDVAVA